MTGESPAPDDRRGPDLEPPGGGGAPGVHPTAEAFGAIAALYDRARPAYPTPLVERLLDSVTGGRPVEVLDLGAGTGILTAQLVSAGCRVVAVDPLKGLLAQLRRSLPDVDARVGSAEAIPAEDDAFDAVTVAQAFHWFDHPVALDEIARVLVPGGTLALIWNRRDTSHPMWAAIDERLEPYRDTTPTFTDGRWRQAVEADTRYAPLRTHRFPHGHTLDASQLVERVASISFVQRTPARAREALLDRVRELPERLGLPTPIRLPYLAELHLTHLRPPPVGVAVDRATTSPR